MVEIIHIYIYIRNCGAYGTKVVKYTAIQNVHLTCTISNNFILLTNTNVQSFELQIRFLRGQRLTSHQNPWKQRTAASFLLGTGT